MVLLDDAVRSILSERSAHLHAPGGQIAHLVRGAQREWSYGRRDVNAVGLVDAETKFPIGSLTKPWIAALAMILAADEDIGLDHALREFFPGTSFSLRQLLSHTAGFPTRLIGPDTSPSDWARIAVRADALAAPGRWSSYSSAGIVAAAALIEQLAGIPWFEAARRFLADPLGVDIDLARSVSHGAVGHLARTDGTWAAVDAIAHPRVEDAAGGLAVSASGLCTFISAVINGTFPFNLPEEYRGALLTDQVRAQGLTRDIGRWSSLSLQVRGERNGGQLVLDCFLDGVVANMRCVPATGEVLILLTNGDRGHLLWRDLRDVLGGVEADKFTGVPIDSGAPHADAPAHVLGRYFDGPDTVDIDVVGEDTVLRVNGYALARLIWHDDAQFTLKHVTRGVLGRGSYVCLGEGEEVLHLVGRVARRQR